MAPILDDNPRQEDSSPQYDAIIVGAGYSGTFMLTRLRQLGLRCKVYEAGKDLGGIWHWNAYPGARVDSEIPVYEFSFPELWSTWAWTEKYPSRAEILKYFDHVDKVLDIRKDVEFETRVVGAQYDMKEYKWRIHTEDGRLTKSTFFIVGSGFAAKRYVPDFKGLDSFKGLICHSSAWPQDGVDVTGKRVAVIGTGATGVQICQEWARDAEALTVFQRTPNLALPMRQANLTAEEQDGRKATYPQFFLNREQTFSGMRYNFTQKNTLDETPEQRKQFYEELWHNGGFEFWLRTYQDMLFDPRANREAYDFWVKKTRMRIKDAKKRDILAPLEPPHPFGTKRPSLEQNYYDIFNQSNVNVVDIKRNKIEKIKPEGILLVDGSFVQLDVIALATGFDGVTGSMINMNLRNVDGMTLGDEWKSGAMTYLGMCHHGYPNMFFLYGTHGPTAFANGPTAVELQGRWVVDAIQKIRDSGLKFVEPTVEAETRWKQTVNQLSDKSLLASTDSWWLGTNIPGKPREQLNYAGGLPSYEKACRNALESWDGFVTV